MDTFYLIVISILFVLAVSDLVVGVSNDAVNFLNSAIGSKVASLRVILIIATLGILAGATFSSGMMEVARKGIFNPGEFFFSDLMIIFLAVMLTDILLLDLFNTFGLPTSTTVSIVFELLGAAVALALIKLSANPDGVHTLGTYINSSKALAIISGILISVVVAFTVGAIVMYLTRVLFTFNYKSNLKYFGSVWGGLAITAITYFMLIKGAKGASFMDSATVEWVGANTMKILLYSFIGWSVLLQVLLLFFKVNIPKIIVLVGTFSLAMAFAGNDLVNFIGVPLAGLESYKGWVASGADPNGLLMSSLAAKVKTPTIFLLGAGIIMALALWTSKKARTVTKTELSLSKQDEGSEMFESSSPLARALVRMTVQLSNAAKFIVPNRVISWLDSRFDSQESDLLHKESDMSFDVLRASINLVVAGVLIAYGTSQKLPLSTTYVTFMVSMGTSMADRAWGRESAVYRITGVMVVITGWFFTALAAFTSAFLIALFINWAGIWAIGTMVLLVSYLLFRSFRLHGKRSAEKEEKIKSVNFEEVETMENIVPACQETIISNLIQVSSLYDKLTLSLCSEDLKALRKIRKKVKKLNIDIKLRKDNVHKVIKKLDDKNIDSAPYYVQIFDYLRESAHALNYITDPAVSHIDNNHAPLSKIQQSDLKELNLQISEYFNFLIYILKSNNFDNIRESIQKQQDLVDFDESLRKLQIKRIKKGESGTKASMLFLGILNESKGLILHSGNCIKAYRDFYVSYNR
jgi:phosphate/sulfate permease